MTHMIDMIQKIRIVVFLIIALTAAVVLFYTVFAENQEYAMYSGFLEAEGGKETQEETEDILKKQKKSKSEHKNKIGAFVCGKVKHIGVYELLEGARLFDFIEAAGGFSKQAAKDYLNLAEKVQDGQRIYIPSKKEIKKWKKERNNSSIGNISDNIEILTNGKDKKVNLNTAKKEELMTLTGIGETKADAIIAYREENGGFQKIEELMQISGIKEGIYKKICDDIVI